MDAYQIEIAILEIKLGISEWSKLIQKFPEECAELKKEFESKSLDHTIEMPSDF